jgi:DNA-binding NarL/FixJ family response regulator
LLVYGDRNPDSAETHRPLQSTEPGPRVHSRDEREERALIRIGIVDDHPVFRVGLIRTIERDGGISVLWELGSVTDLFSMLDTCPVDFVLMDLVLGPNQDALAATREIRERYNAVRVIVISGSLDLNAATAARAAGASGYLPKDLAVVDMVATIRGLASPDFGQLAFKGVVGARAGNNGAALNLRRGLTRREQEVLSELRRGRTNKEIAARLSVAITTINKHVQQVLRKLNVQTRAQAVALVNAEASGLPQPSTLGVQVLSLGGERELQSDHAKRPSHASRAF